MGRLTPAPRGYPIKLVFDKTPEIINSSGEPGKLFYHKLDDYTELWDALQHKLGEEVTEFLINGTSSELVDIYAVVMALAKLLAVDLELRLETEPRGGLFEGVMMYGKHEEFDK